MIKQIIGIISLILCSSCSTNFTNNRALFEQRSPVAKSLENANRYADALTQWKILQIAYPNDEFIGGHILRLELLISERVIDQLSILDKAKATGNEKSERKVYLRILALDPNNKIAIEELRKFEWKFALEEASSKTANIKKYFVETREEANISIQLTKYLKQGEQFIHDREFNELLQFADKFEDSYPSHPMPNDYRLLAYTKLGESQQKQKNPKEAIEYYQKALRLADLTGEKLPSIQMKTAELSELIASRYLKLANKVFKTNLDEAIGYYELSLKYQPSNSKTRQLMQRAIKMRDNLKKIKQQNSNSD